MKKWVTASLLAVTLSFVIVHLANTPDSENTAYAQQIVPFDQMKLGYYVETTQILKERNGISASGWIRVMFHDIAVASSKMDLKVDGTITLDNWQYPTKIDETVDFPTNVDTLLFLRNGGQRTLTIYAGPTGLSIPQMPGFVIDLTRTWNLQDETSAKTPFGNFPAYRYRTTIPSAPAPGGGTTDLTVYASFEKRTQVLAYGEVWATQGVFSALITKVELREANLSLPPEVASRCVIATAAYGSELAGPVQFLREFRDNEVRSTFAGRKFMEAFNRWYYSWAPPIAQGIASSDIFRSASRLLISPVLASLYAADYTFNLVRVALSEEVAIIVAGLISSCLIGIAYLLPLGCLLNRSLGRMFSRLPPLR